MTLPISEAAFTSQVLELVIPGWVPDSRLSLNGRHRTHWRTIALLRTEARLMLENVLIVSGFGHGLTFPPVFDRCQVEFAFVYPTRRRRDPDRLAGLCKPLLDTLVRWGILTDDDSEHVALSVAARVVPRVTETRITINAALRPRGTR